MTRKDVVPLIWQSHPLVNFSKEFSSAGRNTSGKNWSYDHMGKTFWLSSRKNGWYKLPGGFAQPGFLSLPCGCCQIRVFRPFIQRFSQIWLPLAVNLLDPQWLDFTYVEQLVVGGIKVSDALVGHPVDAVNPEFGQTNGTVT